MNKCSLCGDNVVHGITTCGRCRGAQPEPLCAHQFEIAVVALDPTRDIYRCTKCGAERKRHKQPLVVSPEQHMANAKEDARMFGVGFVVDGKRVSPQSVVVVREPGNKAPDDQPTFEQFWLREGPSLAWDEDRKRAARRIWDAARKGGA